MRALNGVTGPSQSTLNPASSNIAANVSGVNQRRCVRSNTPRSARLKRPRCDFLDDAPMGDVGRTRHHDAARAHEAGQVLHHAAGLHQMLQHLGQDQRIEGRRLPVEAHVLDVAGDDLGQNLARFLRRALEQFDAHIAAAAVLGQGKRPRGAASATDLQDAGRGVAGQPTDEIGAGAGEVRGRLGRIEGTEVVGGTGSFERHANLLDHAEGTTARPYHCIAEELANRRADRWPREREEICSPAVRSLTWKFTVSGQS